jgi:3-oxoacid CoA-transferase subunit B
MLFITSLRGETNELRFLSLIFTDLAVIEVTPAGPILKESAPGFTPDEIQAVTEPHLIIAKNLKEINL